MSCARNAAFGVTGVGVAVGVGVGGGIGLGVAVGAIVAVAVGPAVAVGRGVGVELGATVDPAPLLPHPMAAISMKAESTTRIFLLVNDIYTG